MSLNNALQLPKDEALNCTNAKIGEHGMTFSDQKELAESLGYSLQRRGTDWKQLQDSAKNFIVVGDIECAIIEYKTRDGRILQSNVSHAIGVHKGWWIDSLASKPIDLLDPDQETIPKARFNKKKCPFEITNIYELVPKHLVVEPQKVETFSDSDVEIIE